MKKLSLLAALSVALTLGSCSNDQELDTSGTKGNDKEINFRSFIDKGAASRATVTDGNNILGFTVTGWWDKTDKVQTIIDGGVTDPEEALENALTTIDPNEYLFNAYDITRREAGLNNWDYSPRLYWPNNGGGVYFYAYSPASSGNVTATKGLHNYKGAPLAYTVPDPGKKESQEDFLMARTAVAKDKKDGVVTFNFAHVLSRATFSAVKSTPGVTYIIKSVELMNIKKSGTLDFSDVPATGTFTYDPLEAPITYWDSSAAPKASIGVDLGDSPVYVQTEYSSILGPTNALMIMPQQTTYATAANAANTTDFMVKVSYKAFIDPNDPGSYYAGSKNTWKDVYFAVHDDLRSDALTKKPFAFEIGRQYNFRLAFGSEVGGAITFDVSVGDWSDTPQIELPQKNYWFEGLISEAIAKSANSDYKACGLTQSQLEACTTLNISATTDADLKGLEYFTNLTDFTIYQTETAVISKIDAKGLTKLKNITITDYNRSIGTIDLSASTSIARIHTGGCVKIGGTMYNATTTVSKLILPSTYTLVKLRSIVTASTGHSMLPDYDGKSRLGIQEAFAGATKITTATENLPN